MTKVLAFPKAAPAPQIDRGRLLTPQDVAAMIPGSTPSWVVRNVTPRVQLSQRKIYFWEADVLAYLNGRRVA